MVESLYPSQEKFTWLEKKILSTSRIRCYSRQKKGKRNFYEYLDFAREMKKKWNMKVMAR